MSGFTIMNGIPQVAVIEASALPRVLVISHNPFSATTNNGKTMASLFADWPTDRLAQLYFAPMVPDSSVCTRYWRVTEVDLLRARWMGHRYQPGMPLAGISGNRLSSPSDSRTSRLFTLLRRLNLPVLECGREYVWRGRRWKTAALRQWIDNFHPELVYFFTGASVFSFDIATSVAQSQQCPLVLHVSDDWLGRSPGIDPFARRHSHALEQRMRIALDHSPVHITIGDAMAKAYQQRYGTTFVGFMNCVDQAQYPYRAPQVRPGEPLRLVFVGGLHLGRWQSLRDIGLVLASLADDGYLCECLIYTNKANMQAYRTKLTIPPVMRIAGWASADQLPQILADADILVHVESFERMNREVTRYSLSTKIPEYLMVGRPVLAYGPEDIASIRYIDEEQLGIAIGQRQPDRLKVELQRLMTDAEWRRALGERVRMVGVSRHDAAGVRIRFRSLLSQIAAQAE